jgi:fructokinase
VVVVPRGGAGATAVTAGGVLDRPPAPCDLVDTVGAGDAFTAGLLDALAARRLFTPHELAGLGESVDTMVQVLDHAALVAAITCSRAGANPPRRQELACAMAG